MTHYYHRIIEIDAQTVEEFDMIFDAVRHLRTVSTVASPSMVLTYFGEVRMTKKNIIYTFTTFTQWAEFTGYADCCATKQCPEISKRRHGHIHRREVPRITLPRLA
jgi:hypothetical protein